MTAVKNRQLLDEINESSCWVHARKKRPVWSKQIDAPVAIETLEGRVKADKGDYLCRGVDGELWPQNFDSLVSNYKATKVIDNNGWRMYMPRSDSSGVLAAVVRRPFQVQSKWGVLSGKSGDVLIKRKQDEHVDYPDDVWIVEGKLFKKTYRIVK